jgi:hypothetical protein
VNPIATILAAKMMLDWLGEGEKARRIEQATAAVVKEGKVRTYDMGGGATTLEMAEAIARKLGQAGAAPGRRNGASRKSSRRGDGKSAQIRPGTKARKRAGRK